MTRLKPFLYDGAIKISKFRHLRKLQGPHDSMNTPGENKNPRMQIRFRKYQLDKKISQCSIGAQRGGGQ